MSKVPNCRSSCSYHIDLLRTPFRAGPRRLAAENCRRINGRILKTALSALNARPGRYANDDGRAPTGKGGTADLSPDPRPGEISSGLITILLNFE
jgi:hypothetical protein